MTNPTPTPAPANAIASMAGPHAVMPPFGYLFPPWARVPWLQTPPAPIASGRGRMYDDIPSLDPPKIIEDCRLFPHLEKWLEELDQGPWGTNDHNFAQYGADFKREKYVRIIDLEGLKIDGLKALIPGIAQGTVAKILAYSTADIGVIRKW